MNRIPLGSRRSRLHCFLLLVLWLLCPGHAGRAHEDTETHARLAVASFLFLDQVSPSDGLLFSTSARDLTRKGAIDEDDDPLYFNHFFNPKTGATIPVPFYDEQTAPQRASELWALAIQQYRNGQTNAAFETLGHVLHLLQDMTSPAHVHLDPHGTPVPGAPCEGDQDDFEIWGYCSAYGFNAILEYVAYGAPSQILPPLRLGLERIFDNHPQRVTRGTGENTGYAFVRGLANSVYDFTSFHVILEDTPSLENDLGSGELKIMFPTLIEDGTGWFIPNLGWSAGDCQNAQNQDWWMMNDASCHNDSCGVLCKKVSGFAYIENTGGGDGDSSAIPNTLIPAQYNRPWFIRRYGSSVNSARVTMLRIYGDVLYPAAVAYGAGLFQAFLDEAIMPKPVTGPATQLTGSTAQLQGAVDPNGVAASAWFEWGNDASMGNSTDPQGAGSGQTPTEITAKISGLTPDHLYFCRIVSSNRFGLRYGTNQTFRTPAVMVAGDVPNAWQITDHSTTSFLNYITNLSPTLQQAAAANGWRYSVTARLVEDFGGGKAMTFIYGASATRRFLIWWDFDTDGNLLAEIENSPVQVVATSGQDATQYHTHEIIYTNGTAHYWFDGERLGTMPGVSSPNTPAGQVFWGSGSSAGMGRMNFSDLEFEILGVGVVAAYHAGTANDPAGAPNPITQGWTPSTTTPQLPNSLTAVSPDFEPYLPIIEPWPAIDVKAESARLNGQVDPRGPLVSAWFEWGTSANYGHATAPRPVGDGFGWRKVSEDLNGLSPTQTYHFRLVASNDFTVVFGPEQTLVTTARLVIVSSEKLPGQFRLRFVGIPGTTYQVQRSVDLRTWTSVGLGIPVAPGLFEFTDSSVPPEGAFYLVRSILPPP